MNPHHQIQSLSRYRALACLASAVLWPAAGFSQSAPVRPNSPDPKPGAVSLRTESTAASGSAESEDVTKLSPFVVGTSPNDIGYAVEHTLAGSRLNTNLGDLAASITVVTRQQMLDTGSLDMNDIFLYEANTEGTRNYTAFTFNDQGGVSDTASVSPSTANRVRGIGPPDKAHNYYASISTLPFDVYNTESVEINRGPNSLLFGLGSAAGIVNQSSSQANLKRRSNEVSLRYGSEDSYRSSFRINQPLIAGKLALFVAGLYDSRGFTRKPSYDISRRGYLAGTYALTAKTTIRANYERYNGSTRRPNTVTPQDGITEWRQAGSPTWDPITFTVTANGVATRLPNSTLTNVTGLQIGAGSFPAMYYDHGKPVLWMQSALSTADLRGPFPGTLPQMAQSSTLIFKQATTRPLYRVQGITDRSLYDWGSLNATAGNVSDRQAQVYNVEIDQQLARTLFLQAGWYRQDFREYAAAYNAVNMIVIDPNTRLLDGTANPFLGRPFFRYSNGSDALTPTLNDNFRLSLAYQLDLRKKSGWMKWLGSHQFFAIGTTRKVESTNYRSNEVVTDNHTWINPAVRFSGGTSVVTQGAMITPQIYVGGKDGNITQDPGLVVHGPMDLPLRWNRLNPDGSFTWVNEPAHLDQAYNANTNRSSQNTDSLTLGMQSSLLNDRIVPTLGFRRDKNVSKTTRTLVVDPATGFLNLTNLDVFNPAQETFGNTRTAGVVVKPFRWVSLTYNQSRNFTPAALRVDISGNVLPLPKGAGKDYGLRFTLLENKLVLGLNYFEGSAERARGTQADSFMFRVARVEAAFIAWATNVAQQRLGAAASTSAVAAEVARITQLPVGYVPPPLGTISSSSTVEAKGVEVQLIYNPLRNWNIKATLGQQKTVYSNIAPEFDVYTEPRLPVWQSARDISGALYWTLNNTPDLGNASAFWAQNVDNPMKLAKSLEGKRTQGQRNWQASAISTYRVTDGRLKSFEFGGGLRLQDRAIIGYLGAPADPDGVVRKLEPSKPVYDSPRPAADFWISKTVTLPRIFGADVRARIQLNVRGAFENGNRLEPIAVNPNGVANTYRIVDPREWYLTSTFTF